MGPEIRVFRGLAPTKLYRPIVSFVAADSKRKDRLESELDSGQWLWDPYMHECDPTHLSAIFK